MKKFVILPLMVAALCVYSTSYAQDSGIYVGVGGTYAVDDFNVDDFEDRSEPINANLESTWGVNLKCGYHVNEFFSLEALFDYVPDFETENESATLRDKGELDIMTFMVAAKFAWPGRIQPFGVIGAGVMHADWERDVSLPAPGGTVSDAHTQACAKMGIGVDFFATDSISVGIEGTTIFNFGSTEFDLDESGNQKAELGLRYFGITSGVAYHF